MIDPPIFFGVGLLVGSLIGGGFIRCVHNRAVRLTIRLRDEMTPMSIVEIKANKEQLRSKLAASMRHLELLVEQHKAKTTSLLAELGQSSDAIIRLKVELEEKPTTIFAFEALKKALQNQIRAADQKLVAKANVIHETERQLADKEAQLAKLVAQLDESTRLSAGQRIESVALRSQVEAQKTRVDEYERQVKEFKDRFSSQRAGVEAAIKELATEQNRGKILGNRVALLERQVLPQSREVESLGTRIQELEGQLAEQGRLLVERDCAIGQLRTQLENIRTIEADLRLEVAKVDGCPGPAAESFIAEKALVEIQLQLQRTRDERTKLQNESLKIKHDAEARRMTVRVDNAFLREQISDISAQLAIAGR